MRSVAAFTTSRRFFRSASLYLGLLALFVAGTLLSDQFLTLDNQRDVLWQVSSIGIIAVGMTLVILTGGIDLSVGSLLSVCSVVCAMLLMERKWTHATTLAVPSFAVVCGALTGWGVRKSQKVKTSKSQNVEAPKQLSSPLSAISYQPDSALSTQHSALKKGLPALVGVAVCVLVIAWGAARVQNGFGVLAVLLLVPPVGLLMGAVNGVIIAKGRLQPFIVTLAMMVSAVGLAKYVAGFGGQIHPIYMGEPGSNSAAPAAFESLASNIRVFGKDLIPVPGIFFASSAVLAWLLLSKMNVGRYIYSVGGNEEAARYSGIKTDSVKIFVYAVSGMLSALAAVLYCAQYLQGKADAGATRELDAIAAVVIGGTSLMGGRGSIGGTVVGVFIFGYLGNILNLRGVSTEFQSILKGIIIVLAVLLQEGILARWIADGCQRFTALFKG